MNNRKEIKLLADIVFETTLIHFGRKVSSAGGTPITQTWSPPVWDPGHLENEKENHTTRISAYAEQSAY